MWESYRERSKNTFLKILPEFPDIEMEFGRFLKIIKGFYYIGFVSTYFSACYIIIFHGGCKTIIDWAVMPFSLIGTIVVFLLVRGSEVEMEALYEAKKILEEKQDTLENVME